MSGGNAVAVLESISSLHVEDPTQIEAQWFFQPDLQVKSNPMVLQLAMLGGNQVALSGDCYLVNPAQIPYQTTVSCGPGTAVAREQCAQPKVADLSGDGRINIIDVILTLDVFGDCAEDDWKCNLSDFDCNKKVDLFDVMYQLQRWSQSIA